MDNFLRKIADSQEFRPEDRLTDIVEKYNKEELDEESLDLVFAAGKADYREFIKRVEERKKVK